MPSLRLLASLQTQGPCLLGKCPLFRPSRLSKHLRMGSVCMPCHFLTTQTESWSIIKSSAQNKVVHMKLSLRLSFQRRAQPQGLHGGNHRGILSHGLGGFSPMASPSNPVVAPAVTYEYLFFLPSSDRLWPPTQGKAWRLLSGSSTLGTMGPWLRHKLLDTIGSLQ
jgi:hypothetical protein